MLRLEIPNSSTILSNSKCSESGLYKKYIQLLKDSQNYKLKFYKLKTYESAAR